LLARKIVLAKKEAAKARADNPPAGGPFNLLPPHQNKFSTGLRFLPARAEKFCFCPARSTAIKIRSPDFRQKKFGF
jgi:hypothetical protein